MMRLDQFVTDEPVDVQISNILRMSLDSLAITYENQLRVINENGLTGAAVQTLQDLIAYIRDPANTTYVVPAYVAPPDPLNTPLP